ncbi:YhgE/Pip domain-containing protein [Paenibacillus hamazuiensis]|uniref:YhgE/Pip domain-containing protein n=1 Tax=Paenibacillus hamazuiensis TaxID=2936508 RepID=UPI00200C3A4F|nr:ABC transporter permease [Paenibacillus hamazuiensis]
MQQTIQAFLKKPTTIIGIVTALMFQIIFSVIWMTGYAGVSDRTNQLRIAVVNEDAGMGKKVADNLAASLPFAVQPESSLEQAKAKLEAREVQMVMHIPQNFSKALQTPGEKAPIEYAINESNPSLIKSIMQSVASGVTATVNKEAVAQGAQAVLTQANVPAQQAQGMAQGLAEKVVSDFQFSNTVKGTANQMIPMMLVLASFVGAMIMGMNVHQSSIMLGGSVGKWQKFAARAVINIVSAFAIALVGSAFVLALGGQTVTGFLSLWLFESLFLLTFMFFSQMFLMIFGNAGMLFNITMLSVQLVSSGAMVPRELLSGFYRGISEYLPATYAVEGLMNLLFGGPSVQSSVWALIVIMLTAIAVAAAATGLRRQRQAVPAVQPAKA